MMPNIPDPKLKPERILERNILSFSGIWAIEVETKPTAVLGGSHLEGVGIQTTAITINRWPAWYRYSTRVWLTNPSILNPFYFYYRQFFEKVSGIVKKLVFTFPGPLLDSPRFRSEGFIIQ